MIRSSSLQNNIRATPTSIQVLSIPSCMPLNNKIKLGTPVQSKLALPIPASTTQGARKHFRLSNSNLNLVNPNRNSKTPLLNIHSNRTTTSNKRSSIKCKILANFWGTHLNPNPSQSSVAKCRRRSSQTDHVTKARFHFLISYFRTLRDYIDSDTGEYSSESKIISWLTRSA